MAWSYPEDCCVAVLGQPVVWHSLYGLRKQSLPDTPESRTTRNGELGTWWWVIPRYDNAAEILTITVPHLVHLVARQNFSSVTLHRYSATFREVTVHLLSAFLLAMFKSWFLVLLQDTAADNC